MMHFCRCHKEPRLSEMRHTINQVMRKATTLYLNFQTQCGKGKGALIYTSWNYHPLLIYTQYYYKNMCCIIQLHRTALGPFSQTDAGDWVKTP